MKQKKIPRREASTILMGNGAGKANIVIDGTDLKQYVGIGWITLRTATKKDRRIYPLLKD